MDRVLRGHRGLSDAVRPLAEVFAGDCDSRGSRRKRRVPPRTSDAVDWGPREPTRALDVSWCSRWRHGYPLPIGDPQRTVRTNGSVERHMGHDGAARRIRFQNVWHRMGDRRHQFGGRCDARVVLVSSGREKKRSGSKEDIADEKRDGGFLMSSPARGMLPRHERAHQAGSQQKEPPSAFCATI